jgi:hypothetical protein
MGLLLGCQRLRQAVTLQQSLDQLSFQVFWRLPLLDLLLHHLIIVTSIGTRTLIRFQLGFQIRNFTLGCFKLKAALFCLGFIELPPICRTGIGLVALLLHLSQLMLKRFDFC